MTDVDTTAVPAGRRRGRYALAAATVVLTALGVTALTRGAQDRPGAQLPLSTATTTAAAAPASGAPAPGGAGAGVLTDGPLMETSPPTEISIPALRVSASIIGLGQQADGSMEVPDDEKTVGWYTKAPTPGALGPAVLAGHVDLDGKPGTFAKLSSLKAGDQVNVIRSDNTMAMFAVTRVERHAKNKFPSAAVYGPIDHAGLRLITCGGKFDDTSGHYEDNIVVYAALKRSHAM